jgi:hypothetical protein
MQDSAYYIQSIYSHPHITKRGIPARTTSKKLRDTTTVMILMSDPEDWKDGRVKRGEDTLVPFLV